MSRKLFVVLPVLSAKENLTLKAFNSKSCKTAQLWIIKEEEEKEVVEEEEKETPPTFTAPLHWHLSVYDSGIFNIKPVDSELLGAHAVLHQTNLIFQHPAVSSKTE